MGAARRAEIRRKTHETQIELALVLDGQGRAEIESPAGFLNHMLALLARHALVDIRLKAAGDTDVDFHHTVEDVGICLGQALDKALGSKEGITRFGCAAVPMDEALAQVAAGHLGPAVPGVPRQVPRRAGRRLRDATGAGVPSGRRDARQDHAARERALRLERSPHRRGDLQGPRPRPQSCRGPRSPGGGVPSTKGVL